MDPTESPLDLDAPRAKSKEAEKKTEARWEEDTEGTATFANESQKGESLVDDGYPLQLPPLAHPRHLGELVTGPRAISKKMDKGNDDQKSPKKLRVASRVEAFFKSLRGRYKEEEKWVSETWDADVAHRHDLLVRAIYLGDKKAVRRLLNAVVRAKPQYTEWHFGEALVAAASEANREIVRILLDAGADVNLQVQHPQYGTALTAAVWEADKETVKMLLDVGADANLQPIHGYSCTALLAAVLSGGREKVKILLDAGADVNSQTGYGEYGTALTAAVWEQDEETVKMLLAAGADVNLQTRHGRFGNALVAAVLRGNQRMVKVILDAGADVNLQGPYDDCALEVALRTRKKKCCATIVGCRSDDQCIDEGPSRGPILGRRCFSRTVPQSSDQDKTDCF
jgi:hypothetical protein